MVKCQCPMCKESLEAENNWLGQEAECPYCKQVIVIEPTLIKPQRLPSEPRINTSRRYDTESEPVKQISPASAILGWIGMLAWLFPLVGFPITIVGLILGCKKRYALGITLNIIGLVLTLGNSIWGVILLFFQ